MLEETFRYYFLSVVGALTIQVTVTLFAILERNWAIGYVLMVWETTLIFILCLFGQILVGKVIFVEVFLIISLTFLTITVHQIEPENFRNQMV